MANLIHIGPQEAAQAFINLWKGNSFSLGASCLFKRFDVMHEQEVHGSGSFAMTPGLDVQDAAVLRESRYHLDSTLRGLGTEYVKSMCHKYRSTLSNVMIDRALDEDPESYNLTGIADLGFGHEIHRFVTLASDKIHLMLHNKGRDGAKRRKKRAIQQSASVPSKMSGATAVFEREAARVRDIKVKKKRLEQQLGLHEIQKEAEAETMQSSSGDEDMPDLSLRGSLNYLEHADLPSSSD